MMLDTTNIKRLYSTMDHKIFDKIVKMAELVEENIEYDTSDIKLSKIDINDVLDMVDKFFEYLNPEYRDRVYNILHQNVRGDTFISNVDPKYSNKETFTKNAGVCFKVNDDKSAGLKEKNMYFSSGEVVVEYGENIRLLCHIIHELVHKLATSIGPVDIERKLYSEIPSITVEKLLLEWLEDTGYSYKEVQQLKKERNAISYQKAMPILVANELIKSNKDKVDLNEILGRLSIKYSNIKFDAPVIYLVNKIFNEKNNYHVFINRFIETIPYVIGRVMADYYITNYHETIKNNKEQNKEDIPFIFEFIKLFGDGFLNFEDLRMHFMFLDLPFENDNMDELEDCFDGDFINVEYYEIIGNKNQAQA